MTTYTVKYKRPGWTFWRRIKGVKGDGILFGGPGNQAVASRYFILSDDSRIELPISMMFQFDRYRCRMIEENIRRESGGQ